MNEQMGLLIVRQNSIVRAALVTAGVLLIPLWGTCYVDGWNWPWQAFVRVGAFVFSAALTYQLVVKDMSNKAYRFAMGLAIATAVVLTWANFVTAVDVSLAILRISVWSSLVSLGPPSRGCGRAEWRSHWSGRRLLKCSSRSSRWFSGRPVWLQGRSLV